MRVEGNGPSVEVQGLTQEQADQATRYLAAMSLAIGQVALTDERESLLSLWMGYYTNLKNLEQLIPTRWEFPPNGAPASG